MALLRGFELFYVSFLVMNFFSRLVSKVTAKPVNSSSAPYTLEQKLEALASCGLRLAEPFTAEDLLTSWRREQYEKSGWGMVLVGLSMTEEAPPWRDHCENAWHFDSECIEDHGAYAHIAEKMKSMARGSLPIDDIRDYVDVEAGTAWLSFTFNGQELRIDCKVNNDWVDPGVFSHFVRLLNRSDPDKVYLSYYETGGQDCVFACTTRAQFVELKQLGVNFKEL